jgi:hypothetical protein
MCALACAASTAMAQQPTPAKRPVTKADSIAADSIALVREMEKLQATAPASAAPRAPGAKIMPDISVVGDLVGDLSAGGSTQESGARLGVREVELAIQSVVDPYFRGDVYLGFSDVEGARIEQAYMTTTALPWGLQARIGRFLMPVGKQTTTHRHDLHTIEYPWVIQSFLGAEGLKGTGLTVSKVLAPFGFYQELQLSAVDRFGEKDEALQSETAPNKQLDGMGYAARLRNYWDLSQSANLELSASAITGKREQPALAAPAHDAGITAVNARQSVLGADLTFRWRPLQQGLYKSFILQAEVMHQQNERINAASVPGVYQGPDRDFTGGYVFARWQVGRRLYIGGRFDSLQDPGLGGGTLTAGSGVLEFFPSEFSKLVASFERMSPSGSPATNRLLLQATFAVGPHKPHPF